MDQARHLRDLDYGSLLKASKRLEPTKTSQRLNVALLSDAATQRFIPLLRTLFHRSAVHAEVYEGAFDAIELEACDPSSGLYRFQPNAVAILNSVQALRANFARRSRDAAAFVDQTAAKIVGIWDAIQSRSSAVVIQSNFVLPYERYFGNFDQKVPASFYSVVSALNSRIADAARERGSVLINDVESIASWVGRSRWFDDRFWDSAKLFCSTENLPLVANNLVEIVMASRGRIIKCVIADLDNTLWGGIIGDDGLEHILLSAHGDGEAFYRLQCYLCELLKRGILLAVCSKNEMANALLPFEKHPDMILKREDVTVFVANWKDKAENIRLIQKTLNIGFDSMVFLDDNPFERNLVRELLPGVVVPELPEDPADYVRAISELNLFETASFSAEDLKRAELYRREAERKEAEAAYSSLEDFLQSLEMRITVARFDSFRLPRIVQLMQRSNQFNLTTRRLSEVECTTLRDDERWVPLYVNLEDRLGDHGLISVVILEMNSGNLAIRDWLMSCRVLARGVEQYMMNNVFERAQQLGLTHVTGEFIPTAKNAMVKDFFARFGFEKVIQEENGRSCWSLEVSKYRPSTVFIRAMEAEKVEAAS
jgi:FkbH-like protein